MPQKFLLKFGCLTGIISQSCFYWNIARNTGPSRWRRPFHLFSSQRVGTEDMESLVQSRLLIQHMLRPFTHRRNHYLPYYDACDNLESYLPILFPYGRGGQSSVKTNWALGWNTNSLFMLRKQASGNPALLRIWTLFFRVRCIAKEETHGAVC